MDKLVFVYLGQLPEYATYSLMINSQYNKIVLLHDCEITNPISNIEYIHIGKFYDKKSFVNLMDPNTWKFKYRNGFWYKTIERFYVLKSYMEYFKISSLFHAEIDNLIFDLSGISTSLDGVGSGLFYPIITTGKRAAASFMYINSTIELDSMLNHFNSQKEFKDDMLMLAEYASVSKNVHPLFSENNLKSANASDTKVCCYDAASIGQYLFGIDFRNARRPIYNGFQNENCTIDLSTLRFNIDGQYGINVSYKEHSFLLKNVHVHSKIFKKMYVDKSYIPTIIDRNNRGKKSLISLNINNIFRITSSK